jgi:hypothetical protein
MRASRYAQSKKAEDMPGPGILIKRRSGDETPSGLGPESACKAGWGQSAQFSFYLKGFKVSIFCAPSKPMLIWTQRLLDYAALTDTVIDPSEIGDMEFFSRPMVSRLGLA